MKIRHILAALAICGLSVPTLAHAVELFALANFGASTTSLYRIDTGSLATTLVGYPSVSYGFGLGDYNGRLFSYSQIVQNEVVELSATTGATITTFDIGVTAIGEGGIAFDATGKGYLAHATGPMGNLFSFDIGATTHTTVGGLVPSMDGLDFDSSGTLYGYSQALGLDHGSLYTISTVDGTTTLIGTPSIAPGGLSGLTFDANDNLYAITRDGDLWSLDAATAAGTYLGATGLTDVSGLSALRPIPEPSTLGLLGLCLAGLALGRRRRKD